MTGEALSSTVGHLGLVKQTRDRVVKKLSPPGWKQIRLIATKEFADRFRSGWVIACVAVWLGAISLTSFLGLIQIGQIGAQGYERTVISLLNIVQYLVPLLGLLLGHDLIVSETEERTLRLILVSGVSRSRLILGKFLGGFLTLSIPLALGFLIAGSVIGLAAKDNAFGPFIRLAVSGVGLGILFVALGLATSVLCRSRVQALVIALLAWCFFVFVFDLVGLAIIVSTRSPAAAREIEVVCEATHVNTAADIHSTLEAGAEPRAEMQQGSTMKASQVLWLVLNPVDLFRAVNLGREIGVELPFVTILGASSLWLALAGVISFSKFRKTDL